MCKMKELESLKKLSANLDDFLSDRSSDMSIFPPVLTYMRANDPARYDHFVSLMREQYNSMCGLAFHYQRQVDDRDQRQTRLKFD